MSATQSQPESVAPAAPAPQAQPAQPAQAQPAAPPRPTAPPRKPPGGVLAPWMAGRPKDERLVNLLAFAMATETGGLVLTPDLVVKLREEAHAELATYTIRNLHNRVEEIRQQAIMDHVGRLKRPPGFIKLVLANMVALVLVGGLAAGAWLHPEWLDHLARSRDYLAECLEYLNRMLHETMAITLGLLRG